MGNPELAACKTERLASQTMSVSDQPYAGSGPAGAETHSSRAGVLSLFWSRLGEAWKRRGQGGRSGRSVDRSREARLDEEWRDGMADAGEGFYVVS